MIGRGLVALRSSLERFRAARYAVGELLDLDATRVWGQAQDADALGLARRRLRVWADHVRQLRDWCAWRRTRADAITANLAPLVHAYEQGAFATKDIPSVFDRSYYQWWHAAVVAADLVLAGFFSPEHERKIEQFRDVHRFNEIHNLTEYPIGMILRRAHHRYP